MKAGQWIGLSEGNPDGTLLVDLDERDNNLVGTGYLFSGESGVPSTCVELAIPKGAGPHNIETHPLPFDAESGRLINAQELQEFFPDADFPTSATIQFEFTEGADFIVNWKSNLETHGSGTISGNIPATASIITPASTNPVSSWTEYKTSICKHAPFSMVYRGQRAPWPLQTSFHRTKRNDLRRYVNDDIPALHKALTGRTKHIFNLSTPDENGAFLNLAQHHGFPTPLLDWTYSPYIAAYFAFSEAIKENSKEDHVRIFLLNPTNLIAAQTRYYTNIVFTRPHVSLLEPFSIENNRAVPQQGLQMLSNLHNIEAYIQHLESQTKTSIISSFDIPTHFAAEALNDLRLMGITRATLFPGIDGICHEMRIRQFES